MPAYLKAHRVTASRRHQIPSIGNIARIVLPPHADRAVRDHSAALASRTEDQDTIDLTVLSAVRDRQQLRRYHVTHFQPFDPVPKRTEAAVVSPDGTTFKVTSGGVWLCAGMIDAQ
jgi:hypothetical protein